MPKFTLYSLWMDYIFYIWIAAFFFSLFALVYSIRKYLELKNAAFDDEEPEISEDPALQSGILSAPDFPASPAPVPAPAPAPAPRAEAPRREAVREAPAAAPVVSGPASPAETFVHGIYDGISGLDARLKSLEASLAKGRVNNDFAVKFLEDIVQDIDTLDKAKIKARIEYLLTDLKK